MKESLLVAVHGQALSASTLTLPVAAVNAGRMLLAESV